MRLTHNVLIMFVGSFLVQYFVMSPIMTNKAENITNSLGKLYLSVIMGLFMIMIEVAMHDHQYDVFSLRSYVFVCGVIVLMVFLYRTQKYVTDKQYLEEMVEHHSMALLTSQRILEKTDDYNVSKLAKSIIQTQTDEIQRMREMLSK